MFGSSKTIMIFIVTTMEAISILWRKPRKPKKWPKGRSQRGHFHHHVYSVFTSKQFDFLLLLFLPTTLCSQFLFGCKSPSPSSPLNMFHLGTEVPGPPTHQGLFQRRKRKLDVTHTARLLYPSSPSRFTWISSQFTYSTPFILAIHRHWQEIAR